MIKNISDSLTVPIIISIIAIVLFWFISLTLNPVVFFIPGVILAFILYLFTCYKKNVGHEKILPLYLFVLGIQFLHFTEEYLTKFNEELPKLMGQNEYPLTYWVTFNMTAYFIIIIGGIILYKKVKVLMIIPLFFILVGVILNGLWHVILSIYVKGYFPGLYTALL